MLGDGKKIKKNIFLIAGIFSGKADTIILLGFEYTINPEDLMKIVWAIFWENGNFFLCELPLILRVDPKQEKQAWDICKGTLDIEYEQDWLVGLGATLGDGQIDTHRHFF